MSDLVERLREYGPYLSEESKFPQCVPMINAMLEAADRIEELEARAEGLQDHVENMEDSTVAYMQHILKLVRPR